MFANKYLQKHFTKPIIESSANKDTRIIVVIPCFFEPDILQTLTSLCTCIQPESSVEVIVLINQSEISSNEIKAFNLQTKLEIDQWIGKNFKNWIHFFVPSPVEFKKKWAGAGLARKKGMDEAVQRFNKINKPGGIIVSLDADTVVEKNYLLEIEKHFVENPKNVGATISFKHQTKGLAPRHLEGIGLYEKHMAYYKKALDFTGYPYAMFTVGSAFAVTADAYVKRGGMNRRQAGEDFYFLQNLAQMGKIGEITTTMVYPSARLSDRVPFGTGPILQKWMKGEEDLQLSYNFQVFLDLKKLFDVKEKFYKTSQLDFHKIVVKLPEPTSQFIQYDNFWNEIDELNQNCSSLRNFQSRFYQKFNAFKILKYINFAHDKFYKRANLKEQILRLKTHKI